MPISVGLGIILEHVVTKVDGILIVDIPLFECSRASINLTHNLSTNEERGAWDDDDCCEQTDCYQFDIPAKKVNTIAVNLVKLSLHLLGYDLFEATDKLVVVDLVFGEYRRPIGKVPWLGRPIQSAKYRNYPIENE